ncbi:hypothetical protein OBBRIDRAFT_815142 [Obba rivulosa]|uniref:ABC transmembrane type-1 domain-containing protein n=1 Tax=Obba rivulosa TaxID=1052685 RepID=A0A8E2ATZ9_9APHY|nr:hypothetical protein OBBRIDRAFT_815142 [Obba rivulosa]
MLGNTSSSLEIGDLPIVPANMRATVLFANMRAAMRRWKLRIGSWRPKPGSGWELEYRIVRVNLPIMTAVIVLAAIAAVLFYVPAFFLQQTIVYLKNDPSREHRGWGWVFCAELFFSNVISQLVTGQLWSLSTTELQTLVRKDVASSSAAKPTPVPEVESAPAASSTTEADGEAWCVISHVLRMITGNSPNEIMIGTLFLYHLLGVSCFFGLAVTCLFLPMNHFASKEVIGAQNNLIKARNERVALTNEFMAWERSFEKRVLKVRGRELKYQKLNYTIEETVFNEMKFALNAFPETLINMLQVCLAEPLSICLS